MAHYPVFLDLRERSCLVVGGGSLAEEKVRGLLEAGARVTVVAGGGALPPPGPHPPGPPLPPPHAPSPGEGGTVGAVGRWRPSPGEGGRGGGRGDGGEGWGGGVTVHARGFVSEDLDGVVLAIVCGQPPEVVAEVWEEARQRGVLVNTVDDVPHCDFIAPSILRRGDLSIAISTGGRAPALAVRLRQKLEREIGDEHAKFLAMAGTVRAALATHRPDFGERRELWYRLVDSDVLDLLRQGDDDAAARRFTEILGVSPEVVG